MSGGVAPVQEQSYDPEQSLEQKHAGAIADEFDDRLFLTMPFVRYREDGTISGFGEMAYGHIMSERLQRGFILPGVGAPDTHWVDRDTLTIVQKIESPVRLQGMVLRTLPVPCTIIITRLPGSNVLTEPPTIYEVDDTELELEFAYPGIWDVSVKSLKHYQTTFTVDTNGQ